MRQARNAFDEEPSPLGARLFAPATVMLGSLVTILPIVTTFPVLPPFGLLVLLAWRLPRPDVLRIWAPLPLGLFDDLVSGQPIGSAMLTWTACFFMIDLIDRRLMFRDFWQDWLIAAGGIATCLVFGRLVATPFAAHVDTLLLVQIAASILAFPVVSLLVGRLDLKRGRPA